MSKSKNRSASLSIEEIIELFKVDPRNAYLELIKSGVYYRSKDSTKFWATYQALNFNHVIQKNQDCIDTLNRVVWLKLFHDLHTIYSEEKSSRIQKVIKFNPQPVDFIKALFLCVHLGETSPAEKRFPSHTEESLEAIKQIQSEVVARLRTENQIAFNKELVQECLQLIRIQSDINILIDFVEAFVWSDFEMESNENEKGFVLKLSDQKYKGENLFILNEIKNEIKWNFKKQESQPLVSEETHFKKVDPIFKTNEGLATVFHSEGVKVVSQTPGTTSLQVDSSFFSISEKMSTSEQEKRTTNILQLLLQQNFHYQFRHALARIYQPNDEIDIKALHIEIQPSVFFTLYELLSAMSCLIAIADAYRYISEVSNNSVSAFKRNARIILRQQQPELNAEQIDSFLDSFVVENFLDLERKGQIRSLSFVSKDALLDWLRKSEDLKTKTVNELDAIISLFSGYNSPLPFNPIYKTGNEYYFCYTACLKFDLNRMLYSNYVTDKLYNNHKKSPKEQSSIAGNHSGREKRFNQSICDLFKQFTPYAAVGLTFGGSQSPIDFGDLHGEIDVLVYLEPENIFIPIQVKLSNVVPRTEKRKAEWVANNIERKGKEQVIKDLKLLTSEAGINYVKGILDVPGRIHNARVIPLIVTDNFFADHCKFQFAESGETVTCISYFELKHLLTRQKINDLQVELPQFDRETIGESLIRAVEENTFWSFLSPIAEGYKLVKSLSAVNDEYRIEMRID